MIAARSYRADIDGLRTLAVMPVVLFHAGLGFPGGFVGVDIFFVISGFLITGIVDRDVQEGKFSLIRFYERRIRRLYPALFVMLTVTFLFAAWLMIPPDFKEFGCSLAATTIYGSNFFFYLQNGYFNEAAHLKPLLHTWSLSVEEQFYIFFPPVLWALSRYLPRRAVISILAVGALLSLGLSAWATTKNENFAFYWLPTRAWELALGGLLALGAFPSLKERPIVQHGLSWAGLLLILVPVFLYSDATPFPGTAALWPCLGTAFLLWVGRDGWGIVTRALATPPMVAIGKISYSLYLWHWPVIVFATYGAGPYPSVPVGILVVLISMGLAYLSWRFVEQPVRARDLFKRPRDVCVGGLAASVAAIAIGLSVHFAQGFPARVDRDLMAMIDPDQYTHEYFMCDGITLGRVRTGDLCVRGAQDAPPTFALLGDSHANVLGPGIFGASQSAGKAGWQLTAPGFVPLIGVEPLGHTSNGPKIAATEIFLQHHKEIETIIISAFWQHYLTGYTYRHSGTIMADEERLINRIEENPMAVRTGLERLVTSFPDRKFILLDDVPSGNHLYLKHYVRSIVVPWRAPLEGMSSKASVAQRDLYEPFLISFAEDHPNVTYMPLLKGLCGEEVCPLFDDEGRPNYLDGDHLSATGAEALTATLVPLFR